MDALQLRRMNATYEPAARAFELPEFGPARQR
ncbi:hypothetical protein BJY21_003257 [Kineosphaera limosa]|nr:hypothetical protein [Kineosphaera limosa]